jgi:hypothetical protein
MESGLTHVNAQAANKVHIAPDPNNERCEQYCSLVNSLSAHQPPGRTFNVFRYSRIYLDA